MGRNSSDEQASVPPNATSTLSRVRGMDARDSPQAGFRIVSAGRAQRQAGVVASRDVPHCRNLGVVRAVGPGGGLWPPRLRQGNLHDGVDDRYVALPRCSHAVREWFAGVGLVAAEPSHDTVDQQARSGHETAAVVVDGVHGGHREYA